jgi:predicted ArsR family transcriptional regulator
MQEPSWTRRFHGSTRGRLIELLRRSRHTVDELAGTLGLTDNAIRSHLTALERDGLVVQGGLRRGVRKPSYEYELAPAGEELFARAYAPVLGALLTVLDERLDDVVVKELIQATGQRLAAGFQAEGDLEARLETAVTVLNALGGLAEAETSDGVVRIRGYSCPLGAVAAGQPEACQVAQALVSALVGIPLEVCCDLSDRPHCCFAGALPTPQQSG